MIKLQTELSVYVLVAQSADHRACRTGSHCDKTGNARLENNGQPPRITRTGKRQTGNWRTASYFGVWNMTEWKMAEKRSPSNSSPSLFPVRHYQVAHFQRPPAVQQHVFRPALGLCVYGRPICNLPQCTSAADLHCRSPVGWVAVTSTTWHQGPAHCTAALQWLAAGDRTSVSVNAINIPDIQEK